MPYRPPKKDALFATTGSASVPQMPSFSLHVLIDFGRASGDPILGTQRFSKYWM